MSGSQMIYMYVSIPTFLIKSHFLMRHSRTKPSAIDTLDYAHRRVHNHIGKAGFQLWNFSFRPIQERHAEGLLLERKGDLLSIGKAGLTIYYWFWLFGMLVKLHCQKEAITLATESLRCEVNSI